MPIVHSGRRGVNALELLFLAAFFVLLPGRNSLQAATLSDPAVDAYNVRIGTETFAAMYKFSTNTALVETARAITNMGSDIIKLDLASKTSREAGVSVPSNVTNLITLARDCPDYHRVFDMPIPPFYRLVIPFCEFRQMVGRGLQCRCRGKGLSGDV